LTVCWPVFKLFDVFIYRSKRNLLNRLVAVGYDGENKNTETNKGIIWQLEEHLNSPLQWIMDLFTACK